MNAGEDEPARQRGDRFKEGDDVVQQLKEIEEAQRKARQGKLKRKIDSIEKSKQRVRNRLKEIRSIDDLDTMKLTSVNDNQRFQSAVALIDQNRLVDARDALRELASDAPRATVYAKLAEVQWQLNEHDESIENFRAAVRLAPASELASLGLFHSLWERGDQDAALEEMKRFLQVGDSHDYREILQELKSA